MKFTATILAAIGIAAMTLVPVSAGSLRGAQDASTFLLTFDPVFAGTFSTPFGASDSNFLGGNPHDAGLMRSLATAGSAGSLNLAADNIGSTASTGSPLASPYHNRDTGDWDLADQGAGNLQISLTPEPGTRAMMIAGLALIGGMLRMRSRHGRLA
jgi:hypothetical protein